jgi:hypothetical protein
VKNKFFNYPVYFVIVLSFVGLIVYGSILRHHYIGGKKFKTLQKIAIFFAEIPSNFIFIITNKTLDGNIILPCMKKNEDHQIKTQQNKNICEDKEFFNKRLNTQTQQDELVIIARYDGDLRRSIAEIRDLNTFEILHSYLPAITDREQVFHPEITLNGELIFQNNERLLFKTNFNSETLWVNTESLYHHSINTDLEGNIYACGTMNPSTKKVSQYIQSFQYLNPDEIFNDDAIIILNKDGKIIYKKSVTEILIENGYADKIFNEKNLNILDPVHLNDIQPVLKDTPYFKKGDLFLSLRALNMVILYRPSTNKIIKEIKNFLKSQHDVDILDDKRISIFNNNVKLDVNSKTKDETNNQIVIYNFESDGYSIKFQDTFVENKINTITAGLVDFLEDDSAMVEDTNNNRIFYLNSNGEVVWVFNNVDAKKDIYHLNWSRIIDSYKSKKLRKLFNEGHD